MTRQYVFKVKAFRVEVLEDYGKVESEMNELGLSGWRVKATVGLGHNTVTLLLERELSAEELR